MPLPRAGGIWPDKPCLTTPSLFHRLTDYIWLVLGKLIVRGYDWTAWNRSYCTSCQVPHSLGLQGGREPDIMTVLYHNFVLGTPSRQEYLSTHCSVPNCAGRSMFLEWPVLCGRYLGRSDVFLLFEKAPMFGALQWNRVIQSRKSSDDWVMTGWSSSRAT